MDNNYEYNQNTQQTPRPRSGVAVILTIVFVVILAGSLAATYFLFQKSAEEISIDGEIIKKNETVAVLSTEIIRKQIERISTIGTHYASDKRIINLINEGRWEDAAILTITALEDSEGQIEMIALVDTGGTAKSSFPTSPLAGSNFSFRDWYRGVTSLWQPYLSGVYVRATEPSYNVSSFALPVRDELGQPIAIMLLQIKLDTFQNWINGIKIGQEGKTFIVDQSGTIVAHPDLLPQAELVSYADSPDVQKVMSGKLGTEIIINNGQRFISSFAPLIQYGWGVVTRVPVKEVRTAIPPTQDNSTLMLVVLIMVVNIVIATAFWFTVRHFLKHSNT